MRYFDIYYNAGPDNSSVKKVKDAVRKELEGAGQRLSYMAMHEKVQRKHGLMAAFRLSASKRLLEAICEYALDLQIYCSDWALVLASSVVEIQTEITGIHVISDV